jgi:hypothetical protein
MTRYFFGASHEEHPPGATVALRGSVARANGGIEGEGWERALRIVETDPPAAPLMRCTGFTRVG